MTVEEAQARAEGLFAQGEESHERTASTPKYELDAIAIREKTARLRALRLAKEAEANRRAP